MADVTLNQRWAAQLVGVLVAHGVREVVICPGSRSAPLALSWADRADVRTWSMIDERSAAFFALGLAKASGAPAAVVCTSGTAGAHFLPAVIEAFEGCTPLVVLTADRPWELHAFGAPQTIDQSGLFGRFTRATETLPAPDEVGFAHLVAVAERAMWAATQSAHGPVHINVPFREPLAPLTDAPGPVVTGAAPRWSSRRSVPDLSAVQQVVAKAERGVIVCGPRERSDGFGAAVHRLGESLGWPVLAEAASNARYGFPEAITWYDAIVREPAVAKAVTPDVVLRFGATCTSKFVQQWVDGSGAEVVVVSDEGVPSDPAHRARQLVVAPAVDVCDALSRAGRAAKPSMLLEVFQRFQREVERRADDVLGTELSEPLTARALVASLPAGASLVVSSSMPIRDLDAFGSRSDGALHIFANRGVNGIDGVVSTALGVAATSARPTALLIGDVAALHDVSGWLAARTLGLSLTVVVVNNDGGGIFEFLPVASKSSHFERLFATPHGTDFAHVAQLAGARLHRPTTLKDATAAIAHGLEGGLHLIEVRTERRANVEAHRAFMAALTRGLA